MPDTLLDEDFYKFTMQHAVHDQFNNATAKYKFVCRNEHVNLSKHKQQIEDRFTELSHLRFKHDEIDFLSDNIPNASEMYIDYLHKYQLKTEGVDIFIDKDKQLNIEINGLWADRMLDEIYTLTGVNEIYFERQHNKTSISANSVKFKQRLYWLLEEIDRRKLQHYKLIEFGTRRRIGVEWHDYISKELRNILPSNIFLGTSNCKIAKQYGESPLGTTAHEWYSAGQVLFPDNPNKMLDVWGLIYDDCLNTCLTDTMTTKWFVKNITKHQAISYNYRQDSGDPITWVNMIVDMLNAHNIPLKNKTVFFSDSLNFEKSLDIAQYMEEVFPELNYMFGIGTFLSNFALNPLNIVMKLVELNGIPVAKIPDTAGKAICTSPTQLKHYISKYGIRL